LIVQKRDGRKVKFDKDKIKIAVLKAFIDVDGEETAYAKEKARDIANFIEVLNKSMTVEEIQDQVEERLMASNRKDVARKYIIYRNNRTAIREKNTQLMKDISEKLNANNVQNQNANVDEKSFGGRVGEASDTVLKKYALDNCMSEMARNNHLNNEIYIHDLNSYAVGMHNCLSIPFDKLLAEGFNTRQTDVRPAQSVSTAFQLVAVIFQLQSLQQFGGVSATHLDWTMIPYVRKSFYKHYIDGCIYIEGKDSCWLQQNIYDYINDPECFAEEQGIESDLWKELPKVYKYAMDKTEKEVYQAVEGLYHNLNTLQSRSGNQLPFTSINYGTCTEPEGRMVTKALLEVSINGIGRLHKTSIFPCGIFQCMKGVNRKPGDPNYDLFRLALKSTAQRLYPNYANVDWSGNEGYDRNDPKTFFSTMGCVEGNEIITYKFKNNLYVESFKRMWYRLSDYFDIKQQVNGNNENLYLEVDDIKIYDTEKGFVSVKKVIRNTSSEWLNVKMSHGRSLICTIDHPFHTNRGRVRADELKKNDVININPSQYYEENLVFDEHKAWLLGFILCDGCYDGHLSSSIALDTEDDIEVAYIERMKECFDSNIEVIERHRGSKGNYKDLCSVGNVTGIIDYLSTKYEGLTKARRHIPNEVFSWNYNAKLSFLAGMIDADGYINPTTHNGSVVQIGSTNKELALQQMALAQSLGMPCAVYQNHYSKKNPNAIRYRIEFAPSDDLLTFIVSHKKLDNYVENETNYCFFKSEVNSVTTISNMSEYSYDVETESDHFEVSGIYSHNCRTANGWDINGFGQLKDGRGNICPVTIIMPTLAKEAEEYIVNNEAFWGTKEIVDYFMQLLNQKIHEAKDMLLERFEWICNQSPDSAKFMYENGVMEGYDGKDIRSALKHGTLAIGQLGLAETLQILIGCDHTTDKGMELAKQIEQLFKDRCAEFKEQYKLNFGVYYTPAENLCFSAMKKFQEKYGVIPNVSDKKFFTNSIHVPVWIKMTPTEKIDIESQLTGYSSAGCITYVELEGSVKNNLDALETIIDYAMDKDIPYFAINVPNDMCTNCGYCDDINNECPMCGCNEIRRLRRVTGYLTGDYKSAFNSGKQQEVEMRVKHQKF
jgi:ribonucleoside-triphosphate reductase